MENQEQHRCKYLGEYLNCHPDQVDACQDTDRCMAFGWLAKHNFRKHNDPPETHEYLIGPLLEAHDVAWSKYPDVTFTLQYNYSRCGIDPDCKMCLDLDTCSNPRGLKRKPVDNEKLAKKRESLIISMVNKAKEEHARKITKEARQKRQEADEEERKAQDIRRSGPKKLGRFPYGWMLDVGKGHRGAKMLVELLVLVKEVAKRKRSDNLIDGLVASGRFTREQLSEHYTDKNGIERSRPYVLFHMDYQLAYDAKGWKRGKTERLLRKASEAGVTQAVGKLPAENGQMVYCAGAWMTMDDQTWIKWFCNGTDYWKKVFKEFRCT